VNDTPYDEYRRRFQLTGHGEACLSDPTVPDLHLHHFRHACTIAIYPGSGPTGYRGLFLGDQQVAVFSSLSLAERCRELLERHGFADVPAATDDLPASLRPLPPPDSTTRADLPAPAPREAR
jgi:hypothetical protein